MTITDAGYGPYLTFLVLGVRSMFPPWGPGATLFAPPHPWLVPYGRVQEVFQADAGQELLADAVGNRAHFLRSVAGRVYVAAERPRPAGQGDYA